MIFVEGKLELAACVQIEGAQKFDRDAHLPNFCQGTWAVPHHLVCDHGPILANFVMLVYLVELIEMNQMWPRSDR